MKVKPTIVFQDEYLVVINKPAHFLSIPDRFVEERPNVLTFLKKQFGEIFTVHRIDRETSGILVFARDAETHRQLSQQFQNRQVQKHYLALVEGNVHQETGTIDSPIGKSQSVAGKMVIHRNGKPSVTHYTVEELFKNYTLLDVQIETGRTHQIRVHLESIGYPLAVDEMYGRRAAFYLSELKLRRYKIAKDVEERPLMSRSTLHAAQLSFAHPHTKEKVKFDAELPKDFSAVLKQLQKWGK